MVLGDFDAEFATGSAESTRDPLPLGLCGDTRVAVVEFERNRLEPTDTACVEVDEEEQTEVVA